MKGIRHQIHTTQADVLALFEQIESAMRPDDRLQALLADYKSRLTGGLTKLEDQTEVLRDRYKRKLEKRTQTLEKEIDRLKIANETASSENYLLEYKKNALLLLADNLEEAYEEISLKNAELSEQKKQLTKQAAKLQAAHKEILEKNEELEQQKEAIQDQADYLHEANRTISDMHAEVEKQKDEILKKNQELLELNNEKNNLIGIVAHDLKSPLNQIKGLVTIIRLSSGEKLDEETLHCLNSIEQSAARLNEMISKILDVKAIEAQTLNMRLEPVDLVQLARECEERYRHTAAEKNIQLQTELADAAYVQADAGFLSQVLDNLLSNAFKFSQPDTQVSLRLYTRNGLVLLEVRDQGPGLTEADKEKLFGRFQKLSAQPTGNETSTGLGLSIVKQFVEAMQGRIWCESEPGQGASFIAEFPQVNEECILKNVE